MGRPTVRLAVAATAAAAVLLAGCGSGTSGAAAPSTTNPAATSTGLGTSTSAPTQADLSFAQLMIPHHLQAIEMADLAVATAASPRVRQVAKQIKAAQDPEVATMRGWLQAWRAPEQMPGMDGMTDHDMGGMTGQGMMSDAQMKQLRAASGADFDQLWLTMMIAHHDGAIAMADEVMAKTGNPAVTAFAKSIAAGQTQELQTMKTLLAR